MEISQDQLLGERVYAYIQRQYLYDDYILDLCNTEALGAWDRITKVIQGPKKAIIDFLQRLTSAVNRMTPNSEARQIII